MIKALSINDMDNIIVAIEPITRGEVIKYKDKKNNIYLCIKGSFRKEGWLKAGVVGIFHS